MDLSIGSLAASLGVSSIGFGLFMYGKKELRLPQLFVGLVMMVYPYCISRPLPMLGVAAALIGGLWLALRAGL